MTRLLLTVVALTCLSFTTEAQSVNLGCSDSSTIDRRLAAEYGESVVSAGISPGGVIYITSNPTTGTFTILIRRGSESCVVAGGEGFAMVPQDKVGEDL